MRLAEFLEAHGTVAEVRLTRVRGSSPREAGAVIFVAPGATCGTIGGGQLEYMAIDHARAMLARGDDRAAMDVPLGPEIGQCCGGRVEIAIRRMAPADRARALAEAGAEAAARPEVLIFGAGHVGRALAAALALLPVRPVLVDSRAEELALNRAPVETRLTPLPEAEVRRAAPGSAFVVMTHDHSLDFLVTAEALARGDAAYVGLIGSATKRVKFERFCRAEGGPPPGALVCPIGGQGSADKRPEVIAAFVAAEVIATLTRTPARAPAPAQDAPVGAG